MTFSDFRSHAYPLFIKLKLFKVRKIIKLQLIKLLYEFLDNFLPADLKEMFKLNRDIHSHHTRQSIHQPVGSTQLDIELFLNYIMTHSIRVFSGTWRGKHKGGGGVE